MEEEIDYIFVKTSKDQWFRIPDYAEPLFNQLLEESILSESSSKFIREFREFKSMSPTEFRKQLKTK